MNYEGFHLASSLCNGQVPRGWFLTQPQVVPSCQAWISPLLNTQRSTSQIFGVLLYTALSSLVLGPVNSRSLGLPKLSASSPPFREPAGLHGGCHSLCHNLGIQGDKLVQLWDSLTSHHLGIIFLHNLIPNILKPVLSHILSSFLVVLGGRINHTSLSWLKVQVFK
uniref:Uncharacterized protein n=1 Tax=Molossus molossus TaxID=27622 RepID=A0A7J8GQP8_MOLMO|nr:hypothetical protein HJG59_011370 [Molossus molossus]